MLDKIPATTYHRGANKILHIVTVRPLGPGASRGDHNVGCSTTDLMPPLSLGRQLALYHSKLSFQEEATC